SCRMTRSLFIQTIERALRYQITDIATLQRIARSCLTQADRPLHGADVDESFRQRAAYQQGSLTDAPDFSLYDKMLEDNEGDDGGRVDQDVEVCLAMGHAAELARRLACSA